MNEPHLTSAPIHTTNVFRQNHGGRIVGIRIWHFKRVSLRLAGGRADHAESGLPVEPRGAEHQRRPASGLLMSCRGVEAEPDEVAPFGDIACSGHQSITSRPTSGPQSISP